jgi:hypothetical protein
MAATCHTSAKRRQTSRRDAGAILQDEDDQQQPDDQADEQAKRRHGAGWDAERGRGLDGEPPVDRHCREAAEPDVQIGGVAVGNQQHAEPARLGRENSASDGEDGALEDVRGHERQGDVPGQGIGRHEGHRKIGRAAERGDSDQVERGVGNQERQPGPARRPAAKPPVVAGVRLRGSVRRRDVRRAEPVRRRTGEGGWAVAALEPPARAREKAAHDPFGRDAGREGQRDRGEDVKPDPLTFGVLSLLREPAAEPGRLEHRLCAGDKIFAQTTEALRHRVDHIAAGVLLCALRACRKQRPELSNQPPALGLVLERLDQAANFGFARGRGLVRGRSGRLGNRRGLRAQGEKKPS